MNPTLPEEHALRQLLNDEVHARPPEPLEAPTRLSYLALLADAAQLDAGFAAVRALAARYDAPVPAAGNHYSADLGPFRLKWERHTEFMRYTFFVTGAGDETALAAVPADWLAALPGQLLVALHVVVAPESEGDPLTLATRLFARNALIGAEMADDAAAAFADFRIRESGFGRMLVQDRNMTPPQAGRVVQRLLEIDTYRMMALLALPVAQRLAPLIARSEQDLSRITGSMVTASDADEPGLLDRLTQLAAEIDARQAETLYRFNAAAAYYELVRRRIADLRETRLGGLQTFQEFTGRRLAPAMNTCQSVAERQEELSRRVARATQLLATRVSLTRERQNQELLQGVNRRIRLQLRLQATVEGLSVAAITYYVVGLVGYAAKGAEAVGIRADPAIITALAVPIVAVVMALGLRRLRRHLQDTDDA